MSIEALREDLKRNLAEARACASWEDLQKHLTETLWPFLEGALDEMDEMDEAIAEVVDQQEDYVQPETAAVFAAVIQLGLQLGAELKKRHPNDTNVAAAVEQYEQICQQAVEVLGQITMVPNEEDEDEDEDEAAPKDGSANE